MRFDLCLTAMSGCLVGLAVGPVGLTVVHLRDVVVDNSPWTDYPSGHLPALLVTSVPAILNGGIGAVVAARSGRLDQRPVVVVPAALHLAVFVGFALLEPQSAFPGQLFVLPFSLAAWVSGRLGQRVDRAVA